MISVGIEFCEEQKFFNNLKCLAIKEKVMKIFFKVIVIAAVVALAGPMYADQVKVNIVYPINGASYPITNPPPGGLKSAYFTASFSVTCSGDHGVEWGFDRTSALGSVKFYDQISVQFVHKLPGGGHIFWVKSDCGKNEVKFKIGK
jgi:hypothetical protein